MNTLTSPYYLIFINPNKHKKVWNIIKLMLEIREAQYSLYYDYEIDVMELHPVTKNEFKDFNYNPN